MKQTIVLVEVETLGPCEDLETVWAGTADASGCPDLGLIRDRTELDVEEAVDTEDHFLTTLVYTHPAAHTSGH